MRGACEASGVLRDPAIPKGIGQFSMIQSMAPSVGVEVRPVDIRDAGEIERAVTAFARSANGGLIPRLRTNHNAENSIVGREAVRIGSDRTQ